MQCSLLKSFTLLEYSTLYQGVNMLRIILKHMIYEIAIETFFDNVQKLFQMDQSLLIEQFGVLVEEGEVYIQEALIYDFELFLNKLGFYDFYYTKYSESSYIAVVSNGMFCPITSGAHFRLGSSNGSDPECPF